jgi:hypothetical protein
MRDPLSRKLFQTREAREKLRGMGGIMASSPELAQTVAKFNNGGDITVPIIGAGQEPARTTYQGVDFDIFPDGRVVNALSNQEVTEAQDPTGVLRRTIQSLASGELAALGVPSDVAATLSPEEIENIVGFEDITSPMRERFAEVAPAFEDTGPSGVGTFVAETFMPGRAAEARTRRAVSREVAETDSQPAVEPPAAQIIEEEVVEDAAPEPMMEEVAEEPAGPDTGTAAQIGLEGTGAAIGRGDFDTTYEQMLGRLQSVMGTEDKDSREKAMANLAMIGLAIAAGQSPNALTNIAQGALVGMQGIQQAEAAETAREREMRLEAMRLAASEVELSRRLESQERIAGMRTSGGTGTYTPERLYQQNMGAILSNPDMFDVFTDNAVDPNKVTALAQSLTQRGMSLGTTGGEQQFTPGQIVVQDGVTYEYQQDGTWQRAGE